MKRVVAMCGLVSCVACAMPQTAQVVPTLVNAGFDVADGLSGWSQSGNEYGEAVVVASPVVSAPGALQLTAKGPGSSGNRSLMVYQVLDPAPYRGRRVRFGAKVLTRGAGVNITLFTPQQASNRLASNPASNGFEAHEGVLEVPAAATFLSLGLQVFGSARTSAVVDEVFVVAEEAAPGSGVARVAIDLAAPRRPLSPLLFGMHLEWPDLGNGLVTAQGALRDDVVSALRPLRLPLLRFPGGIHADYYDWTKAIGPVAGRQPQLNVFEKKTEPPVFGSQELAALARTLGAAVMITANAGTGTVEAAGAWARYLADQGVPADYWEVGNELYLADATADRPNGRAIARTPDAYAAMVPEYRTAILRALPRARVGIIAHLDTGAFPLAPAGNAGWSERVFQAFKGPADFVAVHNAYAPVVIDDKTSFANDSARDRVYRALFAGPEDTRENLERIKALIDGTAVTRGLPVAVTEWGALFGYSARADMTLAYVDQSRTMAAALYAASLLNVLIGEPRVTIATFTNPIHQWYGGLLTDADRGLIRTPTYDVFELYRTRLDELVVPMTIVGPTFDAPSIGLVKARSGVPTLDGIATASGDGRRVSAMLVNRGPTPLPVELTLGTLTPVRSQCVAIGAPSPNASRGPAVSTTTVVRDLRVTPLPCQAGTPTTVTVPPYSVVSLVMELR